jgi:hypothetical protein
MYETLLNKLQKLPLSLKFVGIGAFLTLISVFLPWYEDLDSFNTGDKFIGLSGPLYLIGTLILAMAIGTAVLIGFRIFEKKLPKLPLEEAYAYILTGMMSLFLLLIASSIYFHSKFGVNITMKQMRFGMIVAFIGSALVALGGFLKRKGKNVSFETEGKLDKLIDMGSQDRGRTEGHVGSHERVQRDIKVDSIRDAHSNSVGFEKTASFGKTEIFDKTDPASETEVVNVNIESKN